MSRNRSQEIGPARLDAGLGDGRGLTTPAILFVLVVGAAILGFSFFQSWDSGTGTTDPNDWELDSPDFN